MKIIGINLIAEPNTKGAGTSTYMRRIFEEIGNSFIIKDCKFIVYKQKQIPKEYWHIPDELDVEYVDVPQLGGGLKRILFEQTFFYKYLKPVDVIFSYCGSFPYCVKSKKVYTQHDIYFLFDKKSYGKLKRLYRTVIVKTNLKLSDKILTVSEYSKKLICDKYQVPVEKIDITYNFIPSLEYDNKTEIVINHLTDYFGNTHTFPENFFLFIGRIQHNKNLERTVEGFKRFLEENPKYYNHKFVVVGKSMYQNSSSLNFLKSENIIYLGYCEEELLNSLLTKCISTVLLSMHEGFGIPIIEGFKNRKPTLTSNTSCLPEVASEAGIKVSPYDVKEIASGFKRILDNYETLTSNISKQLEKFSPILSVETFLKALEIPYELKNKK